MNDVMALDYANYDHTTDNDGIIHRFTTEFPRMSMKYQSKADSEHAPWGLKSKPIQFDSW